MSLFQTVALIACRNSPSPRGADHVVAADERPALGGESFEAVLRCSGRPEVDHAVSVEIAPAVHAQQRLIAVGFDVPQIVGPSKPHRLRAKPDFEADRCVMTLIAGLPPHAVLAVVRWIQPGREALRRRWSAPALIGLRRREPVDE